MAREEHLDDSRVVAITVGHVTLTGDLTVPSSPRGMIVFAHGSGSSRLSPRNRVVAQALVEEGFATLLFDLLTHDEEIAERHTRHLRFDISLLAERLSGALAWVGSHPRLSVFPLGLFGASTGAAAALIAASEHPSVRAIVSRGGRPDLAADVLALVRCPTLLIVGGADRTVIELNRRAQAMMTATTALHLVRNAGHLFEEPGALREVIEMAAAWFRRYLGQEHGHGHGHEREIVDARDRSRRDPRM
jgi:putative phosphoribosyl transferase